MERYKVEAKQGQKQRLCVMVMRAVKVSCTIAGTVSLPLIILTMYPVAVTALVCPHGRYSIAVYHHLRIVNQIMDAKRLTKHITQLILKKAARASRSAQEHPLVVRMSMF